MHKLILIIQGDIKMETDKRYSGISICIMFLIISHFAWIWEGFLTLFEFGNFVNRGFLHGLWLPVYGTGSVILIGIFGRTKHSILYIFLWSVAVCGCMEYLTSLFLELLFQRKWWDYSHMDFNINGRICLLVILLFGIAGCLLVYIIAPFLNKLINKMKRKVQISICIIFGGIILLDFAFSIFSPNSGWGITF